MKKINILSTMLFLVSINIYSQVGVNNTTPQATLDVTAKTTDGTKPEGIIAPRLTGDQIKSANSQYTTAQQGAIVYATSAISSADATGKSSNITTAGYYYFDGSVWQSIGGKVTANNGLTKSGNNIQLGGALTQPTTISGVTDTNNLIVTGTGVNAINFASNTLSVDATNNRVGIGTTAPSTKLEINNGTTSGAIKIVDGTQADGRVFTSDANGIGTWKDGSLKTLVGITSSSGSLTGDLLPGWGTISLSKGTWLVNAKFTAQNSLDSTYYTWITLRNISNSTDIATSGIVPETIGGRFSTPMAQALITVTTTAVVGVIGSNGCGCTSLSSSFGGSQFYAIKLF